MHRTLLCLLLTLMLLTPARADQPKRRTHSFTGAFDTLIVLTAYTADEALFDRAAAACEAEFRRYDHLFNAYRRYSGVNNVLVLNESAAKAPVTVEPELMELLTRCMALQRQMPGTVNIAMGSVLELWHRARGDAELDPYHTQLPAMDELQAAARHMDPEDLVLDEQANTVFFADPALKLDLGAVAKGFAAGKVAETISGMLPCYSINAGGNIVCGDAPDNDVHAWKAGIQNPDVDLLTNENGFLCVVGLANRSLVTSGDYQRYFMVDGVRYHHIIDPTTLMPAAYARAVVILAEDSMLADYLSTAMFLLPYVDGRAMIDTLPGAEAMWVLADGSTRQTEGFAAAVIRHP